MDITHTLLMEIYNMLLMRDKKKMLKGYNRDYLNEILKEDIIERYKLWIREGNPILIEQGTKDWIKLMDTFDELCQPQQINQYGYTALTIADHQGMVEVVRLLKKYEKCKCAIL